VQKGMDPRLRGDDRLGRGDNRAIHGAISTDAMS
jgi:hypothetical protein